MDQVMTDNGVVISQSKIQTVTDVLVVDCCRDVAALSFGTQLPVTLHTLAQLDRPNNTAAGYSGLPYYLDLVLDAIYASDQLGLYVVTRLYFIVSN